MMSFWKLNLFALISALVLLFGTSAFAAPDEDEFEDDDAFEDDDSFEEDTTEDGSESPVDDADPVDAPVEPADIGIGGDGLLLTQGTMQFGGQIGISFGGSITRDVPDMENPQDTSTESVGGGTFFFSPEAGYFVINNLELLAGIGLNIPFGDRYDSPYYPKSIFFNFGAKYFIDLTKVAIYIGGLWGMRFDIRDIEIVDPISGESVSNSETYTSMLLSVPAGVLIPFNRHVALDLGMRFNVAIGLGDNKTSTIDVPIAYFGIQGFFNFFDD